MIRIQSYIVGGFLLFLIISGCSSQKQTAQQTEQSPAEKEIYVFDDVSEIDTNKIDDGNVSHQFNYIVQVGAFTSQERAGVFVNENQSKIPWKMNISFSSRVNLYVVQLPPFGTRLEAEDVRNQLWLINTFKDAFILTVEN